MLFPGYFADLNRRRADFHRREAMLAETNEYAEELARMECDGADASPAMDVRRKLFELPDSTLIGIAATIIEGWTPILLKQSADLTDVDLLIAALRDRSAQFAVLEADADEPYLTLDRLINTTTKGSRNV